MSRSDEADGFTRRFLALVEGLRLELMDEIMEQAIPVDLRLQVHEDRSEADGGPVHEDEFARWRHRAETAQFGMDAFRHVAAIDAAIMLVNAARLVFQQRAIDEMRPAIEHIDHLVIEALESPAFIG